MQRLDVLTNQHQHLSSSPNATNYAPKMMSQMQDEHENVTKESLVTAMNNLLQMRKIRIEKDKKERPTFKTKGETRENIRCWGCSVWCSGIYINTQNT